MPTPFEKIYERSLSKFKSYDIPMMSTDEAKEMLHDYLVTAISKFHICKKDLSRNDILERFNENLSDREIEILSNFLVLEYLDSNYIRVPSLLKVSLTSSDFNSYSPANMLDKLTNVHKVFLAENETLLSRYAWSKPEIIMSDDEVENKNIDVQGYKHICKPQHKPMFKSYNKHRFDCYD